MQVIVKSFTGEFVVTDVDPKDTVMNLKQKIQDFESIPTDCMRLITGLKQLEDERTLEYYEIRHESVIHLVRRLRGGGLPFISLRVMLVPSTTFTSIHVCPVPGQTSVKEAKEMIERETGVHSTLQELSFKGVVMNDNDHFSDYVIKDGDIIEMRQLNHNDYQSFCVIL